jgi:rod shape-determining protein MreD
MTLMLLGQVDRQVRGVVPAVTVFFLVVLGLIPWHIAGLNMVTPAFPLIGVYFWSIYQPGRLPYWAVFLFGVLQDLLLGLPLGQGALSLLVVQGLVVSQRRFFLSKPFFVVWWGFAVVAPIGAMVAWAAASVSRDAVIPPLPIVVQTIITALLYPLFGGLLMWLQQRVLRPAP